MNVPKLKNRVAQFIRKMPRLIIIPYYLYRFVQPKYSVGVVGIVWNNHQVLLVEHVFHPQLPWGLPGGWIGFNESPQQAVTRELKEELGLNVTKTDLILLEKTKYHHLDIAFICQTSNDIQGISSELMGYRWFNFEEIPPIHKFHYDAISASHTFLQGQSS